MSTTNASETILQITHVIAKRFLGIPFLSVAAHTRHIQKSLFLPPEKKPATRTPVEAAGTRPTDSTGQHPALISSS